MFVSGEVTKVIRKDEQMGTEGYRLPKFNVASPARKPVLPTDTQSRRLLIALALLLVVLAAVVARNSDFWFGTEEVADAGSVTSLAASNPAPAVFPIHTQKADTQPEAVAKTERERHFAKALAASQSVTAKAVQPDAAEPVAPVVASQRVVLPPLDVEVVAGDKHSTIHPGSNAVVTGIPADPNRPTALNASAGNVAVNASQQERLSAVGSPELRQTIEGTYPALGQHSRVQGSVVLEAVIGSDGVIEGLRVISGPSILSGAAQQAVRQWRFKPYLQNGHAVETKCTVTVNFSIRVAGESSNLS
jgi:TonB family protein